MSFMDKRFVDVLNCNDNVVVVTLKDGRGYTFDAGSLAQPCVIPIPPDEVQYINSRSNAFKSGVLRFRPDEEAMVYDALGISNTDGILFAERIDAILKEPTAETLQRLVDIRDSSMFERVRGRYYFLINNGESISNKVGKLVEERYKELRAGRVNSALRVAPAAEKPAPDMAAQMAAMQAQMKAQEEMLERYAALLAKLENKNDDPTEAEDASVPVKPAASRTKKSTKTAK